VTVEALITHLDEEPHPALLAEGYLMVDGLCIYHMKDFGITLIPAKETSAARKALSP
jgi:hypothetical protein